MIICPRCAALHNVFVLALQPTKKMCKSEFVEMKKLNTAGRNTCVHHTQERTFSHMSTRVLIFRMWGLNMVL